MKATGILVAVACAVGVGGCGCSEVGIDGWTDTSTDASLDLPGEEVTTMCGNGVVDDGEECDDGDRDDCDGCSNTCRWEHALHAADDMPGAFVAEGNWPCLACPYTVEVWFRMDDEDSAARFFDMPGFAAFGFWTDWPVERDFVAEAYQSCSRTYFDDTYIGPGTWHHFAMTSWWHRGIRYNGLFMDGELTDGADFPPEYLWIPVCEGRMTILDHDERLARSGGFERTLGTMDDLRVSNQALYTADFTPERHLSVRPDTVALWNFNQAIDGVVPDVSGNGHDAFLVEGTLVPDDCHLP